MAKRMNMMTFAAIGAAALCLAAGQPAAAAPGPALPIIGGPGSISAGVFLPSSDRTKNAGGTTQLAVDFHYTLPVPNPAGLPTRTMLSVGVETGAKSGNHSTIIPVTISQLFASEGQSPVSGGAAYFGIGVGAYFENTSGISTSTKIGGFGEIGYNFTTMMYLDAKYQFVQDANGAVLSAGLRF